MLDSESAQVIGIITRRGTGFSHLFDGLLSVFDKNIAALNAAKGMMSMSSVDPVAAIIAGQHQMKPLANEIQRSATVGIGYAFSVEHVLADTALSVSLAHAMMPNPAVERGCAKARNPSLLRYAFMEYSYAV